MSLSRGHGSAYNRGMMDAYYGRSSNPHKHVFDDEFNRTMRVDLTASDGEEYNEYFRGRVDCDDEKDWG